MALQGRHVFLLSLTLFSFLLPVTVTVGMDMDDKPLLHEIRNFPTAKGKSTDLCARIVDYSQFSSCVLQDEGSQLKGIEAGHGPKPKNIMNEVFSEWMEGKGKNPVSWRTLISCLEMTGFRELAGELRKEIDGGLSVEDGDGGGGGDSGTFKEEVTTGGGHGVHIRSGSPKEDEEESASSSLNGDSSFSFLESISHNPVLVAIAVPLILFAVAFLYKVNGKASLKRQRISKIGGADKNSEISDLLEKIDNSRLGEQAIEDDLADVLDALSGLEREWRRIGTNLRLRNSALDTIEANNNRVQNRLHSAMTEWLRLNYNYEKKDSLPSWRMLAKAVFKLDRSVFNKIAEKHPAL